jgi:phosphomannomutase
MGFTSGAYSQTVPRVASAAMSIAPPDIFKAYDIRGLYGSDIDAGLAEQIGRAYTRVIGELENKPTSDLRLGLGHDMRLTAPELAEAYLKGMRGEGATVLNAGEVATEMLYYLIGSRDLDGGLMCTASHNPARYTGAKLIKRGALALSGDSGIGDIRDKIEAGLGDPPGGGSVERVDVYEGFHEFVLGFIDPKVIKPLRVVVDGGNGMAGPMVGPVLRGLGLALEETYFEPDGRFPDHEPNPLLEENREFIMREVVRQQAELGIAWDGDADRCFFIDDEGAFVDGDFLTALLAESMFEKSPGATILYDVRASWAVKDVAERAGGKALMNRVGHAFFKTRMREEHAVFGGEVSGHYYFHDFFCADSGSLPALLILELLSKRGKRISELLEPYRSKYFISGEINTEVSDGEAKMEELAERYSDGNQYHLDGLSVEYDDWHFNVRPSNTEPLLRLTLESMRSREDMESRRDEVLAVIRS